MNFEIPQAPRDKTAGSVDKWKPLLGEWPAQPWVIDAMIAVLAEPDSTFASLIETVNKNAVMATSARAMGDKLKIFCSGRYGAGGYEVWRIPLLADAQRQQEWLGDAGNRVRALRMLRSPAVREAILERYKDKGMEPTSVGGSAKNPKFGG